jgi:hypothetical protein
LNVDKALRSCASAPTAPTGFRVTSR